MQNSDIRLLWTAGWDSTFRLLSALLIHCKTVQPYYLKSHERRSTAIEVRSMERIAEAISRKSDEAGRRLRSPITFAVGDLELDDQITARFHRLRIRSHLGDQYDYLARFAAQQHLSDLELSVHKHDKAHGFLQAHVVREEGGGDPYYRLRDDPPDVNLRIFERYRFPVFDISKLDMERVARDWVFLDVMDLTWFCHTPTANGRPCGTCNPCRYTIEEGLGRRVPLTGRLKHYSRRLLRSSARRLGLLE